MRIYATVFSGLFLSEDYLPIFIISDYYNVIMDIANYIHTVGGIKGFNKPLCME